MEQIDLTKAELETLIIALDELEYNRDQWYQNLDWPVAHAVDRNRKSLVRKLEKLKEER